MLLLVAETETSNFLLDASDVKSLELRHCDKNPEQLARSGSGLPRFWRFIAAPSPHLDWCLRLHFPFASDCTARASLLYFPPSLILARSRWRILSIRPFRRRTNFSLGASRPRSLLDHSVTPSTGLGVTQPSTGHECPRYTFPTMRFEFLLHICGPSACSYYCCATAACYPLPSLPAH